MNNKKKKSMLVDYTLLMFFILTLISCEVSAQYPNIDFEVDGPSIIRNGNTTFFRVFLANLNNETDITIDKIRISRVDGNVIKSVSIKKTIKPLGKLIAKADALEKEYSYDDTGFQSAIEDTKIDILSANGSYSNTFIVDLQDIKASPKVGDNLTLFLTVHVIQKGMLYPLNKTYDIHVSGDLPHVVGWYVGDQHVHSNYSSNMCGVDLYNKPICDCPPVDPYCIPPILNMTSAAKIMGLNWIHFTEHAPFVDASQYAQGYSECTNQNSSDFKCLYGLELTLKQPNHICSWSEYLSLGTGSTYVDGGCHGYLHICDCYYPQQGINNNINAGGLGYIAHPNNNDKPWTDWSVTGYTGIEVWNGEGNKSEPPQEKSITNWTNLANSGKKVYALGDSDAHHMYDLGHTFTYCRMPSLSENNILDALRDGRCVASNGPLVTFTINNKQIGDTVDVCSDMNTIHINGYSTSDIGNLTYAKVYVDGEYISGGYASLSGTTDSKDVLVNISFGRKWVYVRLNTTTGRQAITNPIWLTVHPEDSDGDTVCDYFDECPTVSGSWLNSGCPIPVIECNCSSCSDCETKLNDPFCTVIKLTADIINQTGNCIFNPVNFTGKTFDCQGNTIDGDDSGVDYGISISEKSNDKIRNCVITGFYSGIEVESSLSNIITNNTANLNSVGIYIIGSNNTVTGNIMKENQYYDLSFSTSSVEYPCSNTIENNIGSGNRPIRFFNSTVALENEVLSELILCNADYSRINNVIVTGSDTIKNNAVVVYLTEYSNFTKIDSSDNYWGVRLYSSSNNVISDSTLNSNLRDGIVLDSSPNNTLSYNTVDSNGRYGIQLGASSNNTLAGNIACMNTDSDFYSPYWYSSSGDDNICNNSGSWNDIGTTGCSYVCDAIPPKIQFVNPTETSGSTINRNWIVVNVTTSDSNLANTTIYLYSSTSLINNKTSFTSPHFVNFTSLTEGVYYFNAIAYDSARNSNSTETRIVNIHLECNCSGCDDCETKLDDPFCTVVKLTADIVNQNGTCIDTPENFTSKTFDCQGHLIDGDDSGIDYGIYLYNYNRESNNEIRNCIITDFYYGIHLRYSSDNIISNNTANSNGDGIYLSDSSNNTLTNNTANNNTEFGIYLSDSSNNTLTNNIAKENYIDFDLSAYSESDCSNIIENNTGSEDRPIKYFNSSTTLQNEVLSELILCNADYSRINNVTIIGSKVNKNGIMAMLTDYSNFTNINLSNTFRGIYLEHSLSNVLTTNNVNSNNFTGIYLHSSSNNTIVNNTVNSNRFGVVLSFLSLDNIINNNTVGLNDYGILLDYSSRNTLTDNVVNANKIGVYSYSSNSTINSNIICENIDLDLNSSNWLSSSGDNNTCNKSDGWNDIETIGCTYSCTPPITTTTTSSTSTTSSTTTSSSTTISGTPTTTIVYVTYNTTTNLTANQPVLVNASNINTTLSITTNQNISNANITIAYSSSNPTNTSLSVPELGKYVDIAVDNTLQNSLSSIFITMHYTQSEIDSRNLNESTLSLYWYNNTLPEWQKLTTNMSWVYGTGVNTVDDYVWANCSHTSKYAVGGESLFTASSILLTQGWNLISLPMVPP